MVLNEKTIVFAKKSTSHFCLLQSRIHEQFSRFLSSSLKDDLQYTPSACFETFPSPASLLDANANDPAHAAQRQILESIGERYHQFRADLMVANNEGLTSTYNRFHDPSETSDGILGLRKPAPAAGSGGAPGLRLGPHPHQLWLQPQLPRLQR
jgi:hypothetical protein